MKHLFILILISVFSTSCTNRYRQNELQSYTKKIAQPVDDKPSKAIKPKEKKYNPRNSNSVQNTRRNVISYSKIFDQYTINGNGKYGRVYIEASHSELFGSLSISGSVGQSSIALEANHSDLFNSTSISGDCGVLGSAYLEINNNSVFNKAELTGSLGNKQVDMALSGVKKSTHWTYINVALLALLFDAN